ncbi:hypothetical protein PCASD_22268 [Puccinia coronata f. sp. avenae]|uniref:Tubulin-tyrosine ligase n=1 Tax=Puccinia coronata f. sp. avenae TaxID=200324 RepID=A0A2N5S2Z1_9BASI|nr:hypothetical protein PCASD_22268 [Puccinia coronata f. sp. avenae]
MTAADEQREQPAAHPFRAKQISVCYPSGPSSGYMLGCLLPAITQELPHWTLGVAHPTSGPGHSEDAPHLEIGSIQWSDYDYIQWDFIKSFPRHTLFNAYPIRKALIRKNYLIKAVESYAIKNNVRLEDGIAVPKSYTFALSFPDELDELWADELYDLSEDLNSNNGGSDKKVWILKPALADKGQGIRLFRTKDELYAIFEQLEEDEESHNQSHSSDEEAGEEEDTSYHQKTWVPVSQMRDWIIQEYISNPLLRHPRVPQSYDIHSPLDRSSFHKHHLRVYVLAVGALSVYVYKDILTLFSSKPYSMDDLEDLRVHLTNTCLQEDGAPKNGETGQQEQHNVPVSIDEHPREVTEQIDKIVSQIFSFIPQNDPINFQLLPNSFEVFGLDFLVDDRLQVWLLEVNAGPDFSQTGDTFQPIITELFRNVVRVLKLEYPELLGHDEGGGGGAKDRADKIVEKAGLTAPSLSSSCDRLTLQDSSPVLLDHTVNTPLTAPSTLPPGFRKVLHLQTGLSFR